MVYLFINSTCSYTLPKKNISMHSKANVQYTLKFLSTNYHYLKVEMKFVSESLQTELILPSWTPGSYKIRNYAKNLFYIQSNFPLEQTHLSQWLVKAPIGEWINISYYLYAYESLTVHVNYITSEFALIQGPATFLYPKNKLMDSIEIQIHKNCPYPNIYTQLLKVNDNTFLANNYDELYDSPIFFSFNKSKFFIDHFKTQHEVIIQGSLGQEIYDRLINDLQNIVNEENKIFGFNPNSKYLFILILNQNSYGGLEHKASSVNLYCPEKLVNPDGYKKLLELLAHEYFHLWIGKRVRPLALGPFEYDKPNLTKELWIVEGITSFYDRLTLLRLNLYNWEEYLNLIAEDYIQSQMSMGEDIMSLEESSWNAWIKFYNRNSNFHNTEISYYSKGSLLALCMHLKILKNTKGKKNLRQVLQKLYSQYHILKNKGITKKEFFQTAWKATKVPLLEELKDYLEKPQRIPIEKYLTWIGVDFIQTEPEYFPGFEVKEKNGNLVVSKVYQFLESNPNLEEDLRIQGPNVSLNDEILAVDGSRVQSLQDWDKEWIKKKNQSELKILIQRNKKIFEVNSKNMQRYKIQKFVFRENLSKEEKLLKNAFLQ